MIFRFLWPTTSLDFFQEYPNCSVFNHYINTPFSSLVRKKESFLSPHVSLSGLGCKIHNCLKTLPHSCSLIWQWKINWFLIAGEQNLWMGWPVINITLLAMCFCNTGLHPVYSGYSISYTDVSKYLYWSYFSSRVLLTKNRTTLCSCRNDYVASHNVYNICSSELLTLLFILGCSSLKCWCLTENWTHLHTFLSFYFSLTQPQIIYLLATCTVSNASLHAFLLFIWKLLSLNILLNAPFSSCIGCVLVCFRWLSPRVSGHVWTNFLEVVSHKIVWLWQLLAICFNSHLQIESCEERDLALNCLIIAKCVEVTGAVDGQVSSMGLPARVLLASCIYPTGNHCFHFDSLWHGIQVIQPARITWENKSMWGKKAAEPFPHPLLFSLFNKY